MLGVAAQPRGRYLGKTRSCTVRCETDVELCWLSAKNATRLFFANAQFAYRITMLIARRLQADLQRAYAELDRWKPAA